MNLKIITWQIVDWIKVAGPRDKRRAVAKFVASLRVS